MGSERLHTMLLIVIRAVFLMVVAGLGVRLSKSTSLHQTANWYWVFGSVMAVAVLLVLIDLLTRRKQIQTISAIYFGVIVGLFLSYLLQSAIEPTFELFMSEEVRNVFHGIMLIFICYICISTILQTKDDFRFIIPYVEFSKEVKGARPLVLDTSVVIDGRIADVAETHVIDQPLIVPRFVLQELQGIADSSDKLRRNRGRRGLDILNRLQKSSEIEVTIHDAEIPQLSGIREADQGGVVMANPAGAKALMNYKEHTRTARLEGFYEFNQSDRTNPMKPIVRPVEALTV